jgi:hypothetical protein
MLGFCPIYRLLGISSLPTDTEPDTDIATSH